MFNATESPCPHQRTISGSSANTTTTPGPEHHQQPPSPKKLGITGVTNLLIRARRIQTSRKKPQQQPPTGKPGQIILTSGAPQTHPGVERCVRPDQHRIPVEFAESYVCEGGVNVVPLLVASRAGLIYRAEAAFGAGTLMDEQWECIITGPKPQSSRNYKVQVRYMACATRSSARNPQRPVCIELARGIPGLMTIVKRCDD